MKTYDVEGLTFNVRSKADSAVCDEVCKKKAYLKPRLGFEPNEGDTWIDCGANIGAFGVWLEQRYKCAVIGYEACQENTDLANENLQLNGCESWVETAFVTSKPKGVTSVSFNPKTPARSSMLSNGDQRFVKNVCLNESIKLYQPQGLKIDIEGGEFALLDEGIDLSGITHLAIEYHFRFDKDCKKALRRLQPLIDHFDKHSIPSTIFKEDQWPAWVDAMMFFWRTK